jgi:hypothetical protein
MGGGEWLGLKKFMKLKWAELSWLPVGGGEKDKSVKMLRPTCVSIRQETLREDWTWGEEYEF